MTEVVLSLLDLEKLRTSPLRQDPFDFVIVEDFVRAEHLPGVIADFPPLGRHGSFPLEGQRYGAAFAHLAEELEGDAMRRAIEDKFAIDLEGRPTMIRNGSDSAVRAVPAISRNRLARARRDWTSWPRATFGSARYKGDKAAATTRIRAAQQSVASATTIKDRQSTAFCGCLLR